MLTVKPPKDEQQEAYRALAMQRTEIDDTTVTTFAPFRLEHSAYDTLSSGQVVLLFFVLVIPACFAIIMPNMIMLTIAMSAITGYYLLNLLTCAALAIYAARKQSISEIDPDVTIDWPTYTVLCPLYHEATIVRQFIRAMLQLDYPADRLQVLLLTEEDDTETRAALHAMELPAHFTIVRVPAEGPKTKPKACNYGLLKATGEYVVIYDAEDIPDPLQLKKAVLTFTNGDTRLACVQAQLNVYNPRQSFLTRLFTVEYSLWFDFVLPGLVALGSAVPLGGTSNHFRADILRALGAWDAFNVTEDADLGMRLARYGFHTAVMRSTTYEEGTAHLKNWLRQRSRWIKGYAQTYLVMCRRPGRLFSKHMWPINFVVGGASLFFALNPVMWIMTLVYILFRSHVEAFYHLLFPTPILYAGMLCLIFGNVFYVYMAMLAAASRKQYDLVKWCFLLPFYWGLMSLASFKALWQLIRIPHYREKTEHGLLLATAPLFAESTVVEREDTMLMSKVTVSYKEVPRVTERVKAVRVPVVHKKPTKLRKRKQWDWWLVATLVTATVCSVAAMIYSFGHQDILLYGDAYSHMFISRSVIDSVTPGVGQLGTVWLPLPHLLMLPFIWNDWLWTTGLAGSIPSMIFYLLASAYLFLTARRLTKNNWASFVGTLVFILNPDVLYLQTTPLTEPLCFATFAMAGYYFVAWIQEDNIKYLVLAASIAFLATLARYDGWFLFASMFVLVAVIGLVQKKPGKQIGSNIIIFGFIGGLGIVLWLAWNKAIFGDPFAFLHNIYSSYEQVRDNLSVEMRIVTHNLWQSLRFYGFTCLVVLGPVVSILMVIAIAKFVARRRNIPEMLASLSFLTPLSFYVFSFYTGQVVSLSPGASSGLFNNRFGSEAVLPAALFIATLASTSVKFPSVKRLVSILLPSVLVLVIITQSILTVNTGVITLEEGQQQGGCTVSAIDIYLAQHYNGGMILQDTYLGSPDESQVLGIPQRNIIYQGSQQYWTRALRNPGAMVDWVIIGKRPVNPYPIQVNTASPLFKSQFTLVVDRDFELYVRNGLPPLPNRPIPQNLILANILAEHPYCSAGKSLLAGGW